MTRALDRLEPQLERAHVLIGAALDDPSCFGAGAQAIEAVDHALGECTRARTTLAQEQLSLVEAFVARSLALLPLLQRAESDALRSIATDGPHLDPQAVALLAAQRRRATRSTISLQRELARAYEAHFNRRG